MWKLLSLCIGHAYVLRVVLVLLDVLEETWIWKLKELYLRDSQNLVFCLLMVSIVPLTARLGLKFFVSL